MSATIKGKDLMAMLKRQDFKCYLTGTKLTPSTASLDHKHPVSKGGEHTIDNVCIVHEDVNRAKNSMTEDEFIDMCRAVVQQHGDKNKRKWPR